MLCAVCVFGFNALSKSTHQPEKVVVETPVQADTTNTGNDTQGVSNKELSKWKEAKTKAELDAYAQRHAEKEQQKLKQQQMERDMRCGFQSLNDAIRGQMPSWCY